MPYHYECPFCGHVHKAEYADALEEEVMACRDAHPEKQGRLDSGDWDTVANTAIFASVTI
jgi:hypothetical protein